MKKIIYVLLMLVPFIFSGTQSDAMPPHPDLLKKWREEGTLDANLKKVQSISIQKNMNVSKSSALSSGTVYIPVVLVKYSDTTFNAASTAIFYSDLLNGVTTSSLSVQKYYKDMSNTNLTVVFEVLYTATASFGHDYYGENNSGDDDMHPGALVYEAVNSMVTALDGSTDFSKYDNDNNGSVDTVIVIHTGTGEESSAGVADDIWSHQWALEYAGSGTVATSDGVSFNVYTIEPEYVTSAGDSTIGVFCHELGHVFGLPDLYDTSYETNGVGNWSLMASGSWGSSSDGKDPAPLLAWERYRIGGSSWVNYSYINPVFTIQHKERGLPDYLIVLISFLLFLSAALIVKRKYLRTVAAPASAVILALAVSCTVEPASTVFDGSIDDIESSHEVYRIPLASQQYLVLEGKTAAVSTGWYVPGTGVLVTHIHEGIVSSYFSSNTVNAGYSRAHGITIVEAKTSFEPGKLRDTDTNPDNANTYYGTANDLFCSENKTSLTVSTVPNTKYYTGTSTSSKTGDSGVSITSFSTNGSWPMTFHAEY